MHRDTMLKTQPNGRKHSETTKVKPQWYRCVLSAQNSTWTISQNSSPRRSAWLLKKSVTWTLWWTDLNSFSPANRSSLTYLILGFWAVWNMLFLFSSSPFKPTLSLNQVSSEWLSLPNRAGGLTGCYTHRDSVCLKLSYWYPLSDINIQN